MICAKKCTICKSGKLSKKLNFPPAPISNRFLSEPTKSEEYKLKLGICENCNTIQLLEYPELTTVRPIHSWLNYNEPESHLDAVVDDLLEITEWGTDSPILATTYKDNSTIERLKAKGFLNTTELNYSNLEQPFGLETIQEYLSTTPSSAISKGKKFDCIIARHLIEHAHNANSLLLNLVSMLNKQGVLLIELPESSKIFKQQNYPFIWEEHITYFRKENIEVIASSINCDVIKEWQFNYPYEDSLLIALTPCNKESQDTMSENNIDKIDIELFCTEFYKMRHFWQSKLQVFKRSKKGVALFGAGHLAIRFIKFYQLEKLIDVVIDDHPKKQHKYIPSTNIKIVGSHSVSADEYPICLSILNPESEKKVRESNSFFSSCSEVINCFKAS